MCFALTAPAPEREREKERERGRGREEEGERKRESPDEDQMWPGVPVVLWNKCSSLAGGGEIQILSPDHCYGPQIADLLNNIV